jgi:hypothetical protein
MPYTASRRRPAPLNSSRLSQAFRELEAELRVSDTLTPTDPHELHGRA